MIFKIILQNCYKNLIPTILFNFQTYIQSATAVISHQNHSFAVIRFKYKHYSDDTNREQLLIAIKYDGRELHNQHAVIVKDLLNTTLRYC